MDNRCVRPDKGVSSCNNCNLIYIENIQNGKNGIRWMSFFKKSRDPLTSVSPPIMDLERDKITNDPEFTTSASKIHSSWLAGDHTGAVGVYRGKK